MHLWLVALLAAPEPAAGAVAVAWYEEATVAAERQQQVIERVAEARGIAPEDVITRPVPLARRLVAHEVPRARIDELVEHRRSLDEAEAHYRAGELDEARRLADGVIEALRREAGTPGAGRVAWQAHVLRAQVAWSQGEVVATNDALTAAVALDPDARLSTRRFPPKFAEAHAKVREAALADRDNWPELDVRIVGGEPHDLEVDGRPGPRPVPPGEHFVVVRRSGIAPVGLAVTTGEQVDINPGRVEIRPGFPDKADVAERLCERLELDVLVLARVRDERLGLQGYECGKGFGKPWYDSPKSTLDAGVAVALGIGAAGKPFRKKTAVLASAQPWPVPERATEPIPPKGPADQVRKRRPLKTWEKALIGISGVLVGGAAVTIGVIFGTRASKNQFEIPTGPFLEPSG